MLTPGSYKKIIFIYAIIVFILHVIPTGSPVAPNQLYIEDVSADNLKHMMIFIPWMILVWLYLNKQRLTGNVRFKKAILWLSTGLLLAVISEGIQLYLPHRSFSVMDILSNLSGVVLGAVVFIFGKTGDSIRYTSR